MFKPMLATNIEIKNLRLPVFTSLKLEGVRAEFTPEGLKTRPMKQFNNSWMSQHFIKVRNAAIEKGIVIEGEFYKHGLTFSEISSICRRANHPDTGDLELHIFDVHIPSLPNMPFHERVEVVNGLVLELNEPHVKACNQLLMKSHQEITDLYQLALEDDYEGLCFKDPKGTYKTGRSTKTEQKFLRLKAQNTYDGIVLEIVERMENLVESVPNELGYMSKTQDKDLKAPTGMAAVAITKCPDFDEPIRVTLSRGLTDQDRADIWDAREGFVGKNIRFVGIPVKGMLPRAPRFDAWRTDLD